MVVVAAAAVTVICCCTDVHQKERKTIDLCLRILSMISYRPSTNQIGRQPN